jgi:hypothetical protein
MAMKVQGGQMAMSPIKKAAYDLVAAREENKVIKFGNLLALLKNQLRDNYSTAGTELELLEIARSITSSPTAKATLTRMAEELMEIGEKMERAKRDYVLKLPTIQGQYAQLNEAIFLTKR